MEEEILTKHAEKVFSPLRNLYHYAEIGRLLKGIIHNLNGSLQLLNMHMEVLERLIKKEKINPSIIPQLGKCMEHLDHLKSFSEILMSRGTENKENDPKPILLNQLLEEELHFFRNNLFFKHHVKIEKFFKPRLPTLYGNPNDFKQVFSNIIQNSIEALENSNRKEMTLVTEHDNHHIKIVFQDTGCGISEKIRPHLFKPFVTTKPDNHLGLGLFIAQKLLDRYGGTIEPASNKELTTFSVIVPLNIQNR
jgi:two-component system NtrC family sensor kinase